MPAKNNSPGRRWVIWLLLAAVVMMTLVWLMMLILGTEAWLEPLFHFLFGWGSALQRMVKQWPAASLAWAWFGAGLLLLIVGSHVTFRWLRMRAQTPARPWLWRATLAILTLVWAALFAGMSLVGATHQIGWLAASPEPWIKRVPWDETRMINMSGVTYAVELTEQFPGARAWLEKWPAATGDGHGSKPFIETYATRVFLQDDGWKNTDDMIDAIAIWPRRGSRFRRVGGVIARPHRELEFMDYEEFEAWLRSKDKAAVQERK